MKLWFMYVLFLGGFFVMLACNVRFPCIDEKDCSGGKCVEGFCQNAPPSEKQNTCDKECEINQACCGGICCDLLTDVNNCGACSNKCLFGKICNNGKCEISCPPEQTHCSGFCVNTQIDREHCGSCGTKCVSGQVCNNGRCDFSCPTGQTNCSNFCVNTQIDREHCGSCNTKCGSGQVCNNGRCDFSCPTGQSNCFGFCVNTQNDKEHCSVCGNKCSSGQVCNNGKCEFSCPTGQNLCHNKCVDIQTDRDNCGICGNKCSSGQVCNNGKCDFSCPAGQTICFTSCVNAQTDRDNCGVCNNKCDSGQVCNNGKCEFFCPTKQTNCSGSCVNTQIDRDNCGMCSNKCSLGQVCNNGKCEFFCPAGQTLCNNKCVDTHTDREHCGICGNKCSSGQICNNGRCEFSCPAGQNVCSSVCVNLMNDTNNCGSCGTKCTSGQTCKNGKCDFSCPAEQTICFSSCVNIQTDREHCGICGNKCAFGQVCNSGKCAFYCPAGQTVCSNSCVNTQTDRNNCGSCNNKCADGTICINSKCEISCIAGQTVCSNSCVNTQTDRDNCGSCGNKCTLGQICKNGKCDYSCPTGQTECSSFCVNLLSDVNNCGTCGKKCVFGQACCSGSCTNLENDTNHCGTCSNKCAVDQICTFSQCLDKNEVLVPAGTFTMGSPTNELGRSNDETAHTVTLTHNFAIRKHEIMQGEFKSLMGYNPSRFSSCGNNCPVEQVNWYEAAAFCNALSKSRGFEECFDCKGSGRTVTCAVKQAYLGNDGKDYYKCKGYRLPTEAEWEYSYRSGSTTAFYNGNISQTDCNLDPNLDKIGWYCKNAGGKTHPVGQKQPNAWGLYDMAGNVWEWVYDWRDQYDLSISQLVNPVGPSTGSTQRVARGGGYNEYARRSRAADRSQGRPTDYNEYLGFRVLRSLSQMQCPSSCSKDADCVYCPVNNNSCISGKCSSDIANILFAKYTIGSSQSSFYTMNLDGSGHSLIKNFTADARQAIWNVDKTKIVYSSNSSTTSKYEIFIMDSNGKNDKQITADSPKWWNEYPFFVGNDKIWFGFGVSNGITEFVEINYDGTGRTVKSNFQGQGRQTRIGRAYGNLIYYYKQGHSNSFSGELWKSTLDFSKEIQLTSNSIMDFLNDVSPDGKKIIFFRDGNMSKSNIWIINNDGSGEAQLTITGGSIMSLFTPDGTKILYTYHDGSQTDIYIMNLDGSGKTNITNTPNYDEVLMDCK